MGALNFPTERFERFCSHLVISSKEKGLVPLYLNTAQRYWMERVTAGLTNGVHHFVTLKARQLGISTVCLSLDLFWQFMFPGMEGGLVVDKEKTRDQFKAILEAYLKGLPKRFMVPARLHNRNQLVLANRSRLSYMIAGGRNSGSLSRSEGINFLHATECSSYTDPEGIVSLMASLAETHPHRLYNFESTARGYNLWYDMWKDAKRARTTEAIFIGWWRKSEYSVPRESNIFKVYWNNRLTHEERLWAKQVKKLYQFEIQPEQWAWWRWKLAEQLHTEGSALSEFPFFEDQAFVLTGEQFFDLGILDELYKSTMLNEFQGYTYHVGTRFEDTRIEESRGGELTVYEQPIPHAAYVIAADPAYGESDNSDSFSIQILRAFPDRLEQVAEYNTPHMTMYGFAWVIAHLCGAYSSPDRDPLLILELNGPGRGVLQELLRMPQQYSAQISGLNEQQRESIQNIFSSIQHFLYKRPDTFSSSRLLQWETTYKTKTLMMNLLRDLLERRMLTIRSPLFVEEARFISQEGSRIAGAGHSKDDRVIAMAMGCVAWAEQLQPVLLAEGAARVVDPNGAPQPTPVMERLVGGYLDRMLKQSEESRWMQ